MNNLLFIRKLCIPSSLDKIEECLNVVRDLNQFSPLTSELLFALNIVIMESVQNAIIHGNKNHKDRFVHFLLKMNSDEIVLFVADEGEGYSIRKIDFPILSMNIFKESGRGIYFIKSLSKSFRVLGRGNVIKIIMARE